MAKQRPEAEFGLSERELLIHKVAYLRAQGRTQDEIADKLCLPDRSKVSRLLSDKKTTSLIRTEYCPKDPRLSEYLSKMFEGVDLDKALLELAKTEGFDESYLPKTHTIVTDFAVRPKHKPGRTIDAFGSQCGPITSSFVRSLCKANAKRGSDAPRIVGVCSGRTLRSVVEPLRSEIMHGKAIELEVIPCWGSAHSGRKGEWHSDVHELSATAIANDILKALRRDDDATMEHSLAGVPVVLPPRYKDGKLATLKEFFTSISSLEEIFGDSEQALVESIGMLMLSAGPPSHAKKSFFSESIVRSLMAEDKATELLDHIMGDVGGVLIPNPDKKSRDLLTKCVSEDHWLGLREKHLLSIAKAGRESPKLPGVCAYVAGAYRSGIVLESIRRGYFNNLICDSSLAEQLAKDIQRLKRARGS